MSWSIGGKVPNPRDRVECERLLRAEAHQVELQADVLEESRHQMNSAILAVAEILESGAMGDFPVGVTITGHANPRHYPRDAWGDDMISISLGQRPDLT